MNYFTQDFAKRFTIVLMASIAVGLLLWGLDFTDWANDFTMEQDDHDDHGEGAARGPEGVADAFKPFIKLTVLMLVPAVIWTWASKLAKRFKN